MSCEKYHQQILYNLWLTICSKRIIEKATVCLTIIIYERYHPTELNLKWNTTQTKETANKLPV